MSDSVFVIGAPTPLPFSTTTETDERTTCMSSLDTPDATKVVDDAVKDGVVDAEKRHQLLLLARHHGIESARTAIRLIASARLTAGQREVLATCGISPEEYLTAKSKLSKGE
jgi:hypothetical protein